MVNVWPTGCVIFLPLWNAVPISHLLLLLLLLWIRDLLLFAFTIHMYDANTNSIQYFLLALLCERPLLNTGRRIFGVNATKIDTTNWAYRGPSINFGFSPLPSIYLQIWFVCSFGYYRKARKCVIRLYDSGDLGTGQWDMHSNCPSKMMDAVSRCVLPIAVVVCEN